MKKNKILFIVGGLIVVLLGALLAYFMIHVDSLDSKLPSSVETLSSIEGYNYNLEDRDTAIFKENFESLRKILSNEEIDYQEYASKLATLYIIDLYTISNKINKYDIGGSEYILPEAKENYVLNVEDTIYKYVEDNSYGKRNQELPEVSEVNIETIEKKSIDVLNNKYDGYVLTATWKYKKDLGYDDKATINLVKVDNKLYVTSQSVSQ